MFRMIYPIAAALIIAAPATAAQTATKPAPAKKALAKPAAKAAPAKTPTKTKATAKPTAKPVKPLNVAENMGFGVIQLASDSADKFIAQWKIGNAAKGTQTRTVANQPLFTFLIFRGCKANPEGKCDIVADFVIHRPDGTINDENKGIVVWNKDAPNDAQKSYLGDGALGYGVDDEGPFGEYRIVATTTDRVANVSVTTELTLTIDPAPNAAPLPAPAATPPADPTAK